MSDILRDGATGRAGPLPPNEPHDEFLELCATATTGFLDAKERRRLEEHLSQCGFCREIMAQYQAIVDRVIPAWAPEPAEEEACPSTWSQELAEAQLLARLHDGDKPSDQASTEILPRTKSAGDALWRHLWVQLIAALFLVSALGIMAYRMGMHRGIDLRAPASYPDTARPSPSPPARSPASNPSSGSAHGGPQSEIETLRSQLEARLVEIGRLRAELAQSESETSRGEAERIQLAQDRANLSQQLEIAQGELRTTEQRLETATSQSSQESANNEALQLKLGQLAASLGERDQEIQREQELLDHDRDIRELMGSRDLYIAEVYDVAKTGDTQKPFGRVFYTRGKSLIFYAYDLDQQPRIERASTFQAWGRIGPDRDRAINLGILYQDNTNKKRWILKSDNPKTLAQIDAVFVTVEPNGGSAHPSGKPLLFAYLKIQPNHP